MKLFKDPELLPEEEIIYKTYSFPLEMFFILSLMAFTYFYFYFLQNISLIGYLAWKTPVFTGFLLLNFLFSPINQKYIITNKRVIIRYQNIILDRFNNINEGTISYQNIAEIKEEKIFGFIKAGFIIKYKNDKLIPYHGDFMDPKEFVLQAKKQLKLYNNTENIQEYCTTIRMLTKKWQKVFLLCLVIIYIGFSIFIFKFYKQFTNITHNSAIPFAKAAVYFNPNDGLAYYHLGSAYDTIGKYNEAIINYKCAIELKPHNTAYYHYLAYNYHKSKQYDLEIQTLKKAFKINNKYIFAIAQIAEIYRLKGNYQLAIEYYKKAIKLSPETPNLYIGLGAIYKDLGNNNEAENLFKKALSLSFSHKELSDHNLNPKNLIIIRNKSIGYEYLKENFVENMYKGDHY